MKCLRFVLLFLALSCGLAAAENYPAPKEGDYIARDFKFTSGESLPELRMHYRTLGTP